MTHTYYCLEWTDTEEYNIPFNSLKEARINAQCLPETIPWSIYQYKVKLAEDSEGTSQ